MGRKILLGVGIVAVLGVGACGSDSGGGGGPPASITPKVEALGQAVCDLAFRCCARGELDWFLGPYVDEQNCAARFVEHASQSAEASINLEQFLAVKLVVPNVAALDLAAADGRVKLRPDALVACLTHISGAQCNAYEDVPEGCVRPEPPPEKSPCEPRAVFEGMISEGGRCTSSLGSLECKAGLLCANAGNLGVYGLCVHASQVDEPCVSNEQCDVDLYCSPLDGTCQLPRVEGETCVFADREDPNPAPETLLVRCRSDLSCDPLTDTCVAACEKGASCTNDTHCDDTQKLTCIVNRCDTPRLEGLPCENDADCMDGLHCGTDPADPSSSICRTGLALNQGCFTHNECESGFCDPTTDLCAAPLPAGSLCPTGANEQCDKGRCVSEEIGCTTDLDCPSSGKCDLSKLACASYCIPLLPDGATCSLDSDCQSDECAAGFCRTLPLANGQGCDSGTQCESEFCSLDADSVCKELPLPLGDPCNSDEVCESGVCFESTTGFGSLCVSGLDLGEECGKSGQQPCSPIKYFCDFDEETPVCVPLKETGEACKSDSQCRDTCILHESRMLCSPSPEPKKAVCDGP